MLAEPRSILIFRNGSLGNTLVATPAMRAIRERWPRATMHLVVDALGCELFARCPWFDTIIRYEKRGLDRGPLKHARLVQRLRAVEPTHAVLFKRFFRNGLLAQLSGARTRIGFRTQGAAPFLNLTVPYDETVSIVELNLRLARLLDAVDTDRRLELFLASEDRLAGERFLRDHALKRRQFMVAHYGGSTTDPGYLPPARFLDTLRRLRGGNRPVVLIGASSTERRDAALIAAEVSGSLVAFDLPIRVLAAILEQAELYVGMNSGPAHLAAAAGTPGVVLFRPDGRLERELVKWRPASAYMEPLVPPAADATGAWLEFLDLAQQTADRCMALRAASESPGH